MRKGCKDRISEMSGKECDCEEMYEYKYVYMVRVDVMYEYERGVAKDKVKRKESQRG